MEEPIPESHLSSENKDEAKRIFNQCIEIGMNFKLRPKVLDYKTFEDLFATVNEDIPYSGMSFPELLDLIEKKILPFSTNFSSPYAMAFPDAGNSIAGLSGAILSSFINQNLINWSPCSPMGTIIEMLVISWLRELVGYPKKAIPNVPHEVGGFVTSGGVASNTIAMLLAREKALPHVMQRGVHRTNEQFVYIVPDGIDHYSSRLSIGWLGLGTQHVFKAKTTNFMYDLAALISQLETFSANGTRVLSITAYAGDSRSMTCDNFVDLRKICDRFNIWLHIDGCHGTQLLFSEHLKHKINGISLADSVTFDPHKVLTLPYTISVILVRDVTCLAAIKHPEDIIMGEKHSYGQITPLYGSRAFNSLKLYMLIKHLGRNGIGHLIEKRCALAEYLADLIRRSSDFKLINPRVHINSVMFMYIPDSSMLCKANIDKLNYLNTQIQKHLLEDGSVWLHNFEIPDSCNIFGFGTEVLLRPLRFMSGNPICTKQHLGEMLNNVRICGSKKWSKLIDQYSLNRKLEVHDTSDCPILGTDQPNKKQGSEENLPFKGLSICSTSFDTNSLNFHYDSNIELWILANITPSLHIYFSCGQNHSPKSFDVLSSQLTRFTNQQASNHIALQVSSFINLCAQTSTTGFGKFKSGGCGSKRKWSKVIFSMLDTLKSATDNLLRDQKNEIALKISHLEKIISDSTFQQRFNISKPVLIPHNFDFSHLIIDTDHNFFYPSMDSFLSGDIVYSYAAFLCNSYNTSIGDSFLKFVGPMQTIDVLLLHAYSALFNLRDLVFKLLNCSNTEIQTISPSGNPTSFLALIDTHIGFLQNNSGCITHVSTRNEVIATNNFLSSEDIHTRVSEITKLIRKFCSVEFRPQQKFYVLIYGSYAYRMAQRSSDLDIVFVVENVEDDKRRKVINLVKCIHEKYGLREDNEIPYESKLLLSQNFVDRASSGEGLLRNDRWHFPVIVKDSIYLTSNELLLRFTQGMLVNPHIFVDGCHTMYQRHRIVSTINAIKAILQVKNIRKTSTSSLVKHFCISDQGDTGDFYLGFSYKEPFISYLNEHLESVISSGKNAELWGDDGAVYEFSEEELMQTNVDEFNCGNFFNNSSTCNNKL